MSKDRTPEQAVKEKMDAQFARHTGRLEKLEKGAKTLGAALAIQKSGYTLDENLLSASIRAQVDKLVETNGDLTDEQKAELHDKYLEAVVARLFDHISDKPWTRQIGYDTVEPPSWWGCMDKACFRALGARAKKEAQGWRDDMKVDKFYALVEEYMVSVAKGFTDRAGYATG